jgi:dGTPase
MLSAQIRDVTDASASALAGAAPTSADDVRRMPRLVQFSAAMAEESLHLKRFLHRHLYRHPQVTDVTTRARRVIRDLFQGYLGQPADMRPGQRGDASIGEPASQPRQIADYIAGMTDRFALREHERMTGLHLFD